MKKRDHLMFVQYWDGTNPRMWGDPPLATTGKMLWGSTGLSSLDFDLETKAGASACWERLVFLRELESPTKGDLLCRVSLASFLGYCRRLILGFPL